AKQRECQARDPVPTRLSGLPERDTLSLVPGITRGYSRPARILRPHVQTIPLAANEPRQPGIAARMATQCTITAQDRRARRRAHRLSQPGAEPAAVRSRAAPVEMPEVRPTVVGDGCTVVDLEKG